MEQFHKSSLTWLYIAQAASNRILLPGLYIARITGLHRHTQQLIHLLFKFTLKIS